MQSARSGLKHPSTRAHVAIFLCAVGSLSSIHLTGRRAYAGPTGRPRPVGPRLPVGRTRLCSSASKRLPFSGAVLALDALREEDYMRLVKQALEPKDRLTTLYSVPASVALFRQTNHHLSRPGKNFHPPLERRKSWLIASGSRPSRLLLTCPQTTI